jgi:ABC-type oligopeptide transport system substrate-binding subunit
MTKLRVLIVAAALLTAALLTAACGTATISGSQVKSVSNAGDVRVDAGANAGTDVAASPQDSDLGRVNPNVGKGGSVPVQQSSQPASVLGPSASGHDRCSTGTGSNIGIAPRAPGVPGKQPPLPACAVE